MADYEVVWIDTFVVEDVNDDAAPDARPITPPITCDRVTLQADKGNTGSVAVGLRPKTTAPMPSNDTISPGSFVTMPLSEAPSATAPTFGFQMRPGRERSWGVRNSGHLYLHGSTAADRVHVIVERLREPEGANV